ncbi:MAG: hypothetical protein ACI8ZM_001396 [Crocinitomix sp.]|jgi:hypothetical protein
MKTKQQLLFLSIFLFTFFLNGNVYGQENTKKEQQFPISIMVGNHSWAFPFNQVFRVAPFYPSVSAETEFYYVHKPVFQLYQTAQIGGFINRSSGSAIFFNTNIGMRYTFGMGLNTDLSLGLGYFNGYYPKTTYELTAQGTYAPSKIKSIGASSANISLSIGYDFSKKYGKEFTLFTRYQWIGSTSYWSLIGIRPNGLLKIGVRFNPFHKK